MTFEAKVAGAMKLPRVFVPFVCIVPNGAAQIFGLARAGTSRLPDRFVATFDSGPRCRCIPPAESSARESLTGTGFYSERQASDRSDKAASNPTRPRVFVDACPLPYQCRERCTGRRR